MIFEPKTLLKVELSTPKPKSHQKKCTNLPPSPLFGCVAFGACSCLLFCCCCCCCCRRRRRRRNPPFCPPLSTQLALQNALPPPPPHPRGQNSRYSAVITQPLTSQTAFPHEMTRFADPCRRAYSPTSSNSDPSPKECHPSPSPNNARRFPPITSTRAPKSPALPSTTLMYPTPYFITTFGS